MTDVQKLLKSLKSENGSNLDGKDSKLKRYLSSNHSKGKVPRCNCTYNPYRLQIPKTLTQAIYVNIRIQDYQAEIEY